MFEEAKARFETLQLSKAELWGIVQSSATSSEWSAEEIAAAAFLYNKED